MEAHSTLEDRVTFTQRETDKFVEIHGKLEYHYVIPLPKDRVESGGDCLLEATRAKIRKEIADAARCESMSPDMYRLLYAFQSSLPTSRDWLDPSVEQEVKELLSKAAP